MFSEEEIIDIVDGYNDDFVDTTLTRISRQNRWHTFYEKVVKEQSTGKYYAMCWSRGSTELQDNGIENMEMYEVVPRKIETIVYDRKVEPKVNEKV